ncbi:MAG TPA: COX15/CtaA family protein [Ramlibacter sp.]
MTLLRTMAIACAVLVLAITSLSAFIRLSRAGLGCEPWPQCQAQLLREAKEGMAPAPGSAVAGARIAHRVTAVGALLLVIAMLMAAYASAPPLARQGRLVVVLLGLAVFLAVLGRMTADSRLPAVVLANLLAGFAMFAVSWRLVAATRPAGAAAPLDAGWVRFALALLAAQIVLGGLVSAAHAGASCPRLTGCDLGAASWQALNPWREPDPGAEAGAGALLHMSHRAAGILTAIAVAALGFSAWRRGHRAGALVLVLVVLELGAGIGLVARSTPLALALVHNVLAALLLAAVASLLPDRRWPHAG